MIDKIRTALANDKFSLFVITFLIHEIFVILLNCGVIHVPVSIYDHLYYNDLAIQISSLLKAGTYTFGAVYDQHWYPFFIGVIYTLFGQSVLLGASMNAVLTAASSVLFFEISEFFNNGANKKVIFWTTFFIMNASVSLVFHSSFLLKETWVFFLSLCIIYVFIKMLQRKKLNLWSILLILFLYLALYYLRFFVACAIIFGVIVACFFDNTFPLRQRFAYGSFVTLMVIIMTFCLPLYHILQNYKVTKPLGILQPEFIYNARFSYFKGGDSTTHINVVEKSKIGQDYKYSFSIKGIVLSFLNVMFGPFPWQMSLKLYSLLFLDLLLWYTVLFFSFLGLLRQRNRSAILCIVSILAMILALTISIDNAGALMRYRITLFVLLSLFSSGGVSLLLDTKKNHENTLHHN